MTFTLPKHAAVAVGCGAVAVILGTAVVLLPKARSANPADILPARETVALVRGANQDVLNLLKDRMTGLDGIPLPGHPVDLALFALPQGGTAWAMFDSMAAPAGMRFAISASDASVQAMIGAGENRLADDAYYQGLSGFLDGSARTAYLRFPDITLKDASLFAPQEPLGVAFETGRIRLALPAGGPQASLASTLSPSARALVQSRIRTLFAQTVGTDVSPAYDLQPLLGEPFFADIRGDGFALAGTARNGTAARDTLERLHAGFAGLRAGVEVVDRKLDDQFSYTGVRKADSSAERTSDRVNGYDVERSVRAGGDASLLTAVRGTSVVIATDAAGLAAGMEAARSADFALKADKEAVAAALPFLGERAEAIRWTANRENGRLVLEIQR